jgi:hypothetical protein
MASLIELTASVAPGGETALRVVNSIKAFIQLRTDESAAETETTLDQTNHRIAEHDHHLADLRSRLDSLASSVNQLAASLESASADTVTHADLDSSLAQLELAALQLRDQDRESLRDQIVQHAREQGLLQNAQFRAAFKDELLQAAREQSLSPEDVQRIAAMTPEQTLAAFAASAGGSVVGLIALIRTLGRSRAQADIDQLWEQLKASELRLAESHPAKP